MCGNPAHAPPQPFQSQHGDANTVCGQRVAVCGQRAQTAHGQRLTHGLLLPNPAPSRSGACVPAQADDIARAEALGEAGRARMAARDYIGAAAAFVAAVEAADSATTRPVGAGGGAVSRVSQGCGVAHLLLRVRSNRSMLTLPELTSGWWTF